MTTVENWRLKTLSGFLPPLQTIRNCRNITNAHTLSLLSLLSPLSPPSLLAPSAHAPAQKEVHECLPERPQCQDSCFNRICSIYRLLDPTLMGPESSLWFFKQIFTLLLQQIICGLNRKSVNFTLNTR